MTFEAAAAEAVRGTYGGVEITFIGLECLIANKRASGRLQDIADLEKLERR